MSVRFEGAQHVSSLLKRFDEVVASINREKLLNTECVRNPTRPMHLTVQ
jgi:hypothetical protein